MASPLLHVELGQGAEAHMLSLLEPAPISHTEALERCQSHLGSRSWLYRLTPAFAGPNEDHLIACLAWADALLSSAEIPGPAARSRALRELSEELERALQSNPRSALGHAISATIRLMELAPPLFRGPLEELLSSNELRSFETRQALQVHAQRIAKPIGRILLAACNRSTERNEVLMDALCTGLLLARWTTQFREHWDQGRLNLPVDELTRSRITLQNIDFEKPSPALRHVVADQVRWIRSFFHKGWELSTELGWWRGRLLAFVLRWHAASLSALEARRFDVGRGEPPAGFLRSLACGCASLFTTRPPDLTV